MTAGPGRRGLVAAVVVLAVVAGLLTWIRHPLTTVSSEPRQAPATPAATARTPVATDRHVLVIGIDGLGGADLGAMTPEHIGALMKEGASTLHARGVLPTISSPNWASMIMGAPPEFHGVTSNEWTPRRPGIPPIATAAAGRFPTIFGVARAERPNVVIGIFHQWDGFARLVEPGAADVVEHQATARRTAEAAAAFIRTRQPMLTFVHLDLVDLAGHEFGWRSQAYRRALQTADRLVGELVSAVGKSGIQGRTNVLVSADHGGAGYDHGAPTLRQVEIPWIVWGPGIVPGLALASTVSTTDTAPTIAALLGLNVPPSWTGRPIVEAFEPQER